MGLELHAIENFDPAHWHNMLLDGPRKTAQLENLKTLIRNVGRASIPVFGYNFSLAGVAGRIKRPFARGEAEAVGTEGLNGKPVPNGMVWNKVQDANAPVRTLPPATHDELWSRLRVFLDSITPVAEEAGVTMAAHPDDPPTPAVRDTPQLAGQPSMYQHLIDLKPSPRNGLEFCLGNLAEMTEGDIYDVVDTYSKQEKIAYIHLRNRYPSRDPYPQKNGFDGVLIPDHTPQMSCAAPWHARMAFAPGYMKAALRACAAL